jgi:predicted nuclease of predicted toxin-antitoxin system
VKILIDMNLSPRWRGTLEKSGFEVVHWSDIGDPAAFDSVIMAYAATHDFVVLTSDLDFSAILAATGGRSPSVVQIRSGNLDPDNIADRILSALAQSAEALRDGALVTIDADRARLRLLPLHPSSS